MTVQEMFEKGDLKGAIDEALKEVRSKPLDLAARYRLIILFCFNGELERADKQLTTLSDQQPEAAIGIALMRQLLRAEFSRQEFHAAGRVPEFIDEPGEAVKLHLKASISLREGKTQEANELLEEAASKQDSLCGTCDGVEFEDFRDLDDLFSPVMEALTSTGKYFWIPLSDIISLEFKKAETLSDLLWRPVQMNLKNEPPGAVYVPTLYPGSGVHDDMSVRLGHQTDWIGLDNPPVRGVGLRMFLIGEESKSIMDFSELKFGDEQESVSTNVSEQEDGGQS